MAKKTKHNPDEATLDLGLDEMEAVSQQETGPVTVLGMTFSNDEERRAYFREQLRAKLPELRNIEGFPIGSDDDIVNLSDPPYYTACPNPWLNDFIAEWEQEKLQLEAEGKRLANVSVIEPYAADVSEGKANPIYMAHAYHTKVPHPAIMRYILHYTQPGDIIFDGFAGTGMTGVAAHLSGNFEEVSKLSINNPNLGGRHAICTDLSPYASLIAYNYNTPSDSASVLREAKRIVKEINDECLWMYQIEDENGICTYDFIVWTESFICPNCGNEVRYWNSAVNFKDKCLDDVFKCDKCGGNVSKSNQRLFETIFDPVIGETISIVKTNPALVVCTSHRGKRIERQATDKDIELYQRILSENLPDIPCAKLPDGYNTQQPIRTQGITHAHHFFTRRNLITLAKLVNKINQSPFAEKLRFIFTGLISRATNRNRFSPRNYFFGGGGWNLTGMSGTLYVPSLPIETSLLSILKTRISCLESVGQLLPQTPCNALAVSSACSLNIQSNSIDYIFVDPPFGGNIMYSELNFIPEAWLGVITNYETEAIVNKVRGKSLFEYQDFMYRSFKEFYRILKPGKWMTIEFSNTSASVWNSIQTSLQNVGFIVTNVAALDKKQGSFKAVTTTTAVKQDLIISCFKPTEQLLYKFENKASETNVWDFIDELLSRLPVHLEHSNKTTAVVERSPKILYDRLISFYVQHGFPVPLNAQEFQAGLRERYAERDGMYFTPSQAAKYDELRKRTDGFQASLFFVDSEQGGIAWLNNELSTPQTYQDLQPKWMQAINGVRKGDILPELMQILEENFIKESDGKWRKPNLQDDVDLAALRHKALMREFKVYMEVAQKPRGKIKEARVEALRAGFKQCYQDKDFATIVAVGDRIPQNLLTEDEQLLQFYEIASSRV